MTFLPDGRLVVRASVQIKKGELVTRSLVEVIFIVVMVTTMMMIWITVMVMAMIMNKVVNLVARFQERNSQKLRQVMQCTQLRRIELDRSFLIDCQCSRFFISIISIICIISIISIISTISTISIIKGGNLWPPTHPPNSQWNCDHDDQTPDGGLETIMTIILIATFIIMIIIVTIERMMVTLKVL